MVFERYQQDGKVVLMNSKLDFIQPFKTTIAVHRGSLNRAPGQAESDRQTDQVMKTRESQTDRARGARQTEKKADRGQKRVLGLSQELVQQQGVNQALPSSAKKPRQSD